MNYLWLIVLIISLTTYSSFAQNAATDETSDSATEVLENSTTETLQNEEETTVKDENTINTDLQVQTKRSKWDFSDRSKDKKKNTATKNQSSQKSKQNKFSRPKILNDTETTWKSPVSGKVRQSTYGN